MSTIQTGIRMDASLYERLKRQARLQNRSLNNLIVTILDNATGLKFPTIEEKELEIDEDLLQLGGVIGDIPNELLERDPKIAYILSR